MAEHVCRRVGLYEAELHYEPGLAVHTATSGRLTQLTSLFLVIESDGHTGLAELRINCEYLTGLSPNTMRQQVLDRLCSIDWTESLDHLAAHVSTDTEMPALLHALVETALLDCLARMAVPIKPTSRPTSAYSGVTVRLLKNALSALYLRDFTTLKCESASENSRKMCAEFSG